MGLRGIPHDDGNLARTFNYSLTGVIIVAVVFFDQLKKRGK